jgi:hypothetical protein
VSDDPIDRLYGRARELDPAAWVERDRFWRERGANPDWLERPRSAAEKRMRDRRAHALCLAFDEDIAGGDPAIAAALVGLAKATRH